MSRSDASSALGCVCQRTLSLGFLYAPMRKEVLGIINLRLTVCMAKRRQLERLLSLPRPLVHEAASWFASSPAAALARRPVVVNGSVAISKAEVQQAWTAFWRVLCDGRPLVDCSDEDRAAKPSRYRTSSARVQLRICRRSTVATRSSGSRESLLYSSLADLNLRWNQRSPHPRPS